MGSDSLIVLPFPSVLRFKDDMLEVGLSSRSSGSNEHFVRNSLFTAVVKFIEILPQFSTRYFRPLLKAFTSHEGQALSTHIGDFTCPIILSTLGYINLFIYLLHIYLLYLHIK